MHVKKYPLADVNPLNGWRRKEKPLKWIKVNSRGIIFTIAHGGYIWFTEKKIGSNILNLIYLFIINKNKTPTQYNDI